MVGRLFPLGQTKNYRAAEKVFIRSVNRYAQQTAATICLANAGFVCDGAVRLSRLIFETKLDGIER